MLKGNRIFSKAEAIWGTSLLFSVAQTHTMAFSIKYGRFEQLNNCQLVKYDCTLACTIRFFNKIRGLLTITEIFFDPDNIFTLGRVSVFVFFRENK